LVHGQGQIKRKGPFSAVGPDKPLVSRRRPSTAVILYPIDFRDLTNDIEPLVIFIIDFVELHTFSHKVVSFFIDVGDFLINLFDVFVLLLDRHH
jgi:hypothetical protein